MNKFFLTLSCLILSKNFVSGNDNSIVGDYWVGFGYQHYSNDLLDQNTLQIASNFPVLKNIDLGVSGSIGQISTPIVDLGAYGLDFGTSFHNEFETQGGVLKSIDPYFGINLGILYIEQSAFFYSGGFLYYTYNYETFVPLTFHAGSEFKFGDFFLLRPFLRYITILNEDVDNTFNFGIAADFLISEYFSLGLGISGDDDSGVYYGLGLRYHM
jgi:hypothetical protein